MQHINGSFDKKKYPGCRGTRCCVEAWGGVLGFVFVSIALFDKDKELVVTVFTDITIHDLVLVISVTDINVKTNTVIV